ncbi:SDR family NAD(P)-dependent oxidoreductase [Bifidobacterium avesanii]|uniref:SDR family NAD(P)-dependent oxidoreductase n=1 Tax=Bifidobacterium avesanii TaxID=1798157 RepID=A0A7K3TH61_9BIFI|nr:SDR family NAD(P)-dependent oxidoreductase [Bifidobacterium avesanii]KAB8293607.1 short-chain dehydrogenase [Bifidobacterium avesanii]NEG78256.1 SDR family NAD(P)-dependent oxidoreductase [Bifidobacterium avesanii]
MNGIQTRTIAIVTGASSGLGAAFLEAIVARYRNLDEIWIVARRERRLRALAGKYGNSHTRIRTIPLDLTGPDAYGTLTGMLEDERPNIRVLINNAGYEREGVLRDMSPADIRAMIDLNVTAMTMVSRVCLPYMGRGSFAVITGSVSPFAPIPWQAVYAASKAYVRFLSRALHEEERERGVNVLLFSPGNMDTEMNVRGAVSGKLARLPYLDLRREAVRTLARAERGCATYTPLAFYRLYRIFAKLAPSALAVRVTSLKSGGAAAPPRNGAVTAASTAQA